jgi:hypothetical protein
MTPGIFHSVWMTVWYAGWDENVKLGRTIYQKHLLHVFVTLLPRCKETGESTCLWHVGFKSLAGF